MTTQQLEKVLALFDKNKALLMDKDSKVRKTALSRFKNLLEILPEVANKQRWVKEGIMSDLDEACSNIKTALIKYYNVFYYNNKYIKRLIELILNTNTRIRPVRVTEVYTYTKFILVEPDTKIDLGSTIAETEPIRTMDEDEYNYTVSRSDYFTSYDYE